MVLRLKERPVTRSERASACSAGILETSNALISCTKGEALESSLNPSTRSAGNIHSWQRWHQPWVRSSLTLPQ